MPEARGELAQVVLVGQAGQTGEDVLEVGERILAVALAGDDQRVEDGGTLPGLWMADEQPVLCTGPN